MSTQNGLVQRLWSYCNVLRDDGLSYGDYLEQLTYLLFLKMADEQTKPPFSQNSIVPEGLDWPSLLALDGDALGSRSRRSPFDSPRWIPWTKPSLKRSRVALGCRPPRSPPSSNRPHAPPAIASRSSSIEASSARSAAAQTTRPVGTSLPDDRQPPVHRSHERTVREGLPAHRGKKRQLVGVVVTCARHSGPCELTLVRELRIAETEDAPRIVVTGWRA